MLRFFFFFYFVVIVGFYCIFNANICPPWIKYGDRKGKMGWKQYTFEQKQKNCSSRSRKRIDEKRKFISRRSVFCCLVLGSRSIFGVFAILFGFSEHIVCVSDNFLPLLRAISEKGFYVTYFLTIFPIN